MRTGEKDNFCSGPGWNAASATICLFVFGAQFLGQIPGSGSGVAVRAYLGGSRQVVQSRFSGIFRFWNEGGCQAWDFGCPICGPAGRASFGACSGAGPEFILRNAAVTEQLVAEIATRLCGPHSRERLFRCKRLINKFNSTGTFRRQFLRHF